MPIEKTKKTVFSMGLNNKNCPSSDGIELFMYVRFSKTFRIHVKVTIIRTW